MFYWTFDQITGSNNEYYQTELTSIGPLDQEFTLNYFKTLITDETEKLSIKAFLATKQRILGIVMVLLKILCLMPNSFPNEGLRH